MGHEDFHLSDEQLLREIDSELLPKEKHFARSHLDGCRRCQERLENLELASHEVLRAHRETLVEWQIPHAQESRSELTARLRQASQTGRGPAWPPAAHWWASAAAVGAMVAVAFAVLPSRIRPDHNSLQSSAVFYSPDSRLTPGAAIPIDRGAVCSEHRSGNKAVPVSVQRRVFEEYRIAGADPRAYEVDHLITPALGGSDDIGNLWPQAYSAPVWNARAKDALEDQLRDLVCAGGLELGEAQREISTDWIRAYKKYFRTEKPLPEHRKGGE